jgi:hypothetical protein
MQWASESTCMWEKEVIKETCERRIKMTIMKHTSQHLPTLTLNSELFIIFLNCKNLEKEA